MASKSRKKRTGDITKSNFTGKKGLGKLLEEIIRESLSPECNRILLESKIRELENADKNYVPLLSRMVTRGKTNEQKVIFDLLVRKKNGEVIDSLKNIIQEDVVSVKIRRQALNQLERWGGDVDEELRKLLDEGEVIISIVEKYAEFGESLEPELEASIIQRFTRLSKSLKVSIIKQLLDEYPHGLQVVLKLTRGEADLDERIINQLAERGTAEIADLFCTFLVETKNKGLRRLLKKHLFQMKNKGLNVVIPTIEEEEPLKFQKMESHQPNAYVTSIDYLGDRLIFLSKSTFGWGMVFFQITVSDQEGIKNLSAFNLNRREIKNFLNRISEGGIIHLMEINPEYCHFLIEEAYQVNIKKGITPPEQFVQWKVEIDDIKGEIVEPIIYAQISKETIQEGKTEWWRSQYQRINELDLFKGWFLEPRFVWEYIEKYNDVATSPLILNPYQTEERKESIISEAAERIFTNEYRGLYKRRLEEMAYILFRMNQEESAKLVLLAADDLRSEGLSSKTHGFLKELVKKSILLYGEDEREQRRDQLIITPR